MKGFYIEITNNLLDRKHVKNMGSAVWEYMWCLDKMTKIDEDGKGWVLGGKPIKREEIKKDIGKDEGNISQNLQKLEKFGYINLLRTPYGNVISVNKAKKRYGNKATSSNGDNATSPSENATSIRNGDNATNKEDSISIDNTEDKTIILAEQSSADIIRVIDCFEKVNPAFKKWYGNKTQRASIQSLIESHGLEKVLAVVSILPKTNGLNFVTTITTPQQLEDRWATLEAQLRKIKNERTKNVIVKL